MTALARVVFALLIAATFSAFFVAQRLKGSPPVVGSVKVVRFFSPNQDGRRDVERVSFQVKEADDVTVDIVDAGGGRVRRLARAVAARPYRPVRLSWDGRDDTGARVPDGRYRLRLSLRRSGRSVVATKAIDVDTTAPRPEVARARAVGGTFARRGPAIVAPGRAVDVTVKRPSRYRRTQFAVWRTDDGRPRPVARFEARRRGSRRGTWDGLVDGLPAPVGTYLVVPTVEDRAGNRGSGPAELPPEAGAIPGRPGVLVRRLAIQAPLGPQRVGARMTFLVDSRGVPYRWNLRRVGGTRRVDKGSARPGRPLAVRAPAGPSGAYLLEVRTGRHATRVPVLVQSEERERILVVLPAITWLGADRIDDDGDGLPDTLQSGVRVRTERPLTGLPPDFAERSAPLLAFLDRARIPYDITSDLALAATDDPSPTDREGVLLAGEERWIPRALATRLRRYVERGGRVASFGTGSLRRGVTLSRGVLSRPTQATATDAFGARLRPLRRLGSPVELVTLADDPSVGLLEAVSDVVEGFSVLEESVPSPRGPLRLLAGVGQDLGEAAPLDAETGDPRTPLPALTGSRLGRGIVVRVGLPQWAARLREDPAVQQITRNAADLLRRVRPRPRSPLR